MPMVGILGLPLLAAAGILNLTVSGGAGGGLLDPILANSGPAASNWEVLEWTAPLTVSVDTASIANQGARLTARVLWDYAEPRTTGEPAATSYKSMIGVLVFDCATLSLGGAGTESFSDEGGEGRAVARYWANPDNARLGAPLPGTLAHDLVTYVCAHAPHAGTA